MIKSRNSRSKKEANTKQKCIGTEMESSAFCICEYLGTLIFDFRERDSVRWKFFLWIPFANTGVEVVRPDTRILAGEDPRPSLFSTLHSWLKRQGRNFLVKSHFKVFQKWDEKLVAGDWLGRQKGRFQESLLAGSQWRRRKHRDWQPDVGCLKDPLAAFDRGWHLDRLFGKNIKRARQKVFAEK
jgi:hypothetical protein